MSTSTDWRGREASNIDQTQLILILHCSTEEARMLPFQLSTTAAEFCLPGATPVKFGYAGTLVDTMAL